MKDCFHLMFAFPQGILYFFQTGFPSRFNIPRCDQTLHNYHAGGERLKMFPGDVTTKDKITSRETEAKR